MPQPLDYGLSIGSNSLLTCWSPFGISSLSFLYPSTFRPGVGVFNINFVTSQRHFRDGMTSTIMISEICGWRQVRVADSLLGFDVNSWLVAERLMISTSSINGGLRVTSAATFVAVLVRCSRRLHSISGTIATNDRPRLATRLGIRHSNSI